MARKSFQTPSAFPLASLLLVVPRTIIWDDFQKGVFLCDIFEIFTWGRPRESGAPALSSQTSGGPHSSLLDIHALALARSGGHAGRLYISKTKSAGIAQMEIMQLVPILLWHRD